MEFMTASGSCSSRLRRAMAARELSVQRAFCPGYPTSVANSGYSVIWYSQLTRNSSWRRVLSSSCRGFASSAARSEEHTSELQSHSDLVCRLLLEKKKQGAQPDRLTSLSLAPRPGAV